MQLSPMVNFNGRCEEAFKFYEQCLGGRIQTMMTWGESPMADQVASEWRDKIVHASLIVGETSLLGNDSPPESYEAPKGISVTIHIKDVSEAERVFKALAENGTVQMPFEQTFWSAGFGMCVDRFGIPWMINTEQAPA